MELTALEEKVIHMLRQDNSLAEGLLGDMGDLKMSESVLLCDKCHGVTRHECVVWNDMEESCYCAECHSEKTI